MATRLQSTLPDDLMSEIWDVMHLAATPDYGSQQRELTPARHVMSFECGGDTLESDSPLDGNSNVKDLKAAKETADKLARIGDSFNDKAAEEKELVNDITRLLLGRAKDIDVKLADKCGQSMPSCSSLFQNTMLNETYNEISSKFQNFLWGSPGTKIGVVAHITKGVSDALRNESPAAVNMAAAISSRYVGETFASDIQAAGGLHNLVTAGAQ